MVFVLVQVVVLCFSVFLGSFYQGLSPCSSITKTGLTREISIQESYTATGAHARIVLEHTKHGCGILNLVLNHFDFFE